MTTIITGMRNFIAKHIGGTLLSCRLDCAIKMELRVVAIKVSRCQHGKVSLRYEDCLSSTTADFYKGNVEL